MVGFTHLWKADKLSDVDVSIRIDESADEILVIPAHQAILSSSPYFWAQVGPPVQANAMEQLVYCGCSQAQGLCHKSRTQCCSYSSWVLHNKQQPDASNANPQSQASNVLQAD